MITDFRKNRTQHNPVVIKFKWVEVERVSTYKYLGVIFDSSLNWKKHHHKESPLMSPLLKETEIF